MIIGKNKHVVLGICWNHDAHAAVLTDGQIVASVGEERISRIKNHFGFPYSSIKECLKISNFSSDQVDVIAIANEIPHPAYATDFYFNKRDKQYDTANKSYFYVKFLILKHIILRRGRDTEKYNKMYLLRCLKNALKELKLDAEIKFFDHHKCHAASAYYSSGFKDSFVAVLDQYGDNKCVSFWAGKKNKIQLINSYDDIMSPGAFYTEVTKFLGFKRYRHEGKVTGLAARGNANILNKKFKKLLTFNPKLNYFSTIRPLAKLSLLDTIVYGIKKIISLKPYQSTYLAYQKYFIKVCSGHSKENIAAAAQSVLEEFTLDSINHNLKFLKTNSICLAGGIFANVLVNQKVLNIEEIKKMFVFPNMGDGGLAVGAAQLAFFDLNKDFERVSQKTFFLGDHPDIKDLESLLKSNNLNYKFYANQKKQVSEISNLLSNNKIVGLYKGRMEFGPRALCNRSIIASPKNNNINIILNKRLNRTEFMPFAPVIRVENLKQIFPKLTCDIPAKFMTVTASVNSEVKSKIPAVVHIDGTARPQIISKVDDEFMYELLKEFENITSIPALINTSFNAHEEPIVCSHQDAIRAFNFGSVDVLVIDNYIIHR
tara:strand:- start:29027 stop:30826 length:1800 start_codon:yes stop_codon:yes gene_type:complete